MAGVRGLSPGGESDLPRLRTPRLRLTHARPDLAPAMARFLVENFPGHLDRWSPPPAPGYFSEVFWAERFEHAMEDFRADRALRFVLQEERGGPIVGSCNYTNIVRGAFHACHLGYQIARSHEGRGLMSEALREANAYVFAERRLHRIMANYRPENERSGRLLERLGFSREGYAERYLFIDGAWRDHVLTSLVNPAFADSWLAAP